MNQQLAVTNRTSVKDYIQLTKPGILRSNLFAAFAGFWLASQWDIHWLLLLHTLLGTTLILASSCVFNNLLDRDLDRKMERTSHRALPAGRLPVRNVVIFASVLGAAGLTMLAAIHWLPALLGLIGMFVYIIVYTAWLKRTSTLSTVMGAFSGSMPPVLGYTAVTHAMDAGAWILFAVLFFWQPPHFWALGIRRLDEYRRAGFQILPVVKGVPRTKWQMLPYVILVIPASVLLYSFGYVGIIYLIVSLLLGIGWLAICIAGFFAKDTNRWARTNFIFSINYLTLFFIVLIIDTVK